MDARLLMLAIVVVLVATSLVGGRNTPNAAWRRRVLRWHGAFMVLFAGPTWFIDMGIYWFDWGVGPFVAWRGNPMAIMGFFEALGLGVTCGACFLAASRRSETDVLLTAVGAAMGGILGTANTTFWEVAFEANDFAMQGAVSTAFHWSFCLLHLVGLARYRPGSAAAG